jgi:hypothetical protein
VIDPLNISGGGFFNWITVIWIIIGWTVIMFISFSVFYCSKTVMGEDFKENSNIGFWDMDIKDLNEFFRHGDGEDVF